ncbi:MAG TPA: rRNA adenine N-6-methyltransferase family protein [Xanthobacteraceae bacterium]|nr:rRNA adenine N-6-methyltransferase family protein [Xanthobacteraceae bacterium]
MTDNETDEIGDIETRLAAARRWYAEDLRLRAPIRRNFAIVEAFAAVPRERFLGAPPWRIIPDVLPRLPVAAPDASARWVYHDVLVAIDPERSLNNGMPSLWARIFDHLSASLHEGGRVLQVGAGTGYYTAVLAEMVGGHGHVTAVEIDRALAARARDNLEPWPQVEVVAGDGCMHDPGEVDTVIVCAGATHPAPLWLDRLAPGGELMLPLTNEKWWGFLLRASRPREGEGAIMLSQARAGNWFQASSIGRVGIFPCAGGRDQAAAGRLRLALEALFGDPQLDVPIEALHRGDPGPEDMDRVWYHGPGFWLERKKASHS